MTSVKGSRVLASVAAVLLLAACDASKDPAGKDSPGDEGGGTASASPRASNVSGDWSQWGYSSDKNMTAPAKNLPFALNAGEVGADDEVEMGTTENVLWVAKMGSYTYGNPTVAGGRVYVGTNNEGRGDPRFKGDHSILRCLDEKTGKEIWTLTVPKLGTGKVGDWELLGICSSPTIVDNRVYLVTNRCEVMALDVEGMANGNQGYQDEGQYMSMAGTTPKPPVEVKSTDADIIWIYDMRDQLGVYPHNITSSSILVVDNLLFCSTSNGVTYDHTDIPFPKAPALIALDRELAEKPDAKPEDILYGEEGSGLSKRVLHGNWTSPCWGTRNGKGVILYGGPEGYLYCFDPKAVKDEDGFGVFPEIWRYDCNPIHYRYKDGDTTQPIKYVKPEGPSEIIATPVYYKGRVYAPIGQDPEHGEGLGNLTCVDVATGKKVWDFRGIHRSISTCAIVDDKVYVGDFSGWIYCIDANDGKLYWKYDSFGEIWGSPLVADGKLYLGNADSVLNVFKTGPMLELAEELGAPIELRLRQKKLEVKKDDKVVKEIGGQDTLKYHNAIEFPDRIDASVIVANDVLYVATMRHLYAIKAGGK